MLIILGNISNYFFINYSFIFCNNSENSNINEEKIITKPDKIKNFDLNFNDILKQIQDKAKNEIEKENSNKLEDKKIILQNNTKQEQNKNLIEIPKEFKETKEINKENKPEEKKPDKANYFHELQMKKSRAKKKNKEKNKHLASEKYQYEFAFKD